MAGGLRYQNENRTARGIGRRLADFAPQTGARCKKKNQKREEKGRKKKKAKSTDLRGW